MANLCCVDGNAIACLLTASSSLCSIGDEYEPKSKTTKGSNGAAGVSRDSFLPEFTTRELARQTNDTLQAAVRRDGVSFVPYLDGFIVALREELDSPSDENQLAESQRHPVPHAKKESEQSAPTAGLTALRYPPPVERTPYRVDVNQDGTGIESPGWFSSTVDGTADEQRNSESNVMSRLCALDWVVVLYESVVPILLKADVRVRACLETRCFRTYALIPSHLSRRPKYAREFVFAIIHQLLDSAPKSVVYKSLEVLAKITVPAQGEVGQRTITSPSVVATIANPTRLSDDTKGDDGSGEAATRLSPMNESNISYAFDILEPARRGMMSRNREVFSALIDLYSCNMSLMGDLSSVIAYMCRLQPPEFVFVSFAVELDRFISRKISRSSPFKASALDLRFVSSFVQNLNHVLLNKPEAKSMRSVLRDCVRFPKSGPSLDERARQRSRLFHILLHSFAHNLAATISLCIWAGAYRTTYLFLNSIDPLDTNLMFLLEVDRFIEHLERPLFRYVIRNVAPA